MTGSDRLLVRDEFLYKLRQKEEKGRDCSDNNRRKHTTAKPFSKESASMKTVLFVAFLVVALCLVCEAVQVQVSSSFSVIKSFYWV